MRSSLERALNERLKDRNLVAIEIAAVATEKVVGWAKLFAWLVAVPLAALAVLLAVLGISKFSDLQRLVKDSEDNVRNAVGAANEKANKFTEQFVALDRKVEEFGQRIEANKAQIAAVDADVQVLKEGVIFIPDQKLDDELRRHFTDEAKRFQTFFLALGYQPKSEKFKISVSPTVEGAISYYDLENQTIFIRPDIARDTDVLFREYSHRILYGSLPESFDQTAELVPIEWGLANYFACTVNEDPKMGEVTARILKAKGEGFGHDDYVYDLDNHLAIGRAVVGEVSTEAYRQSEAWGGVFWEIRTLLTRQVADRVLFDAWREFHVPRGQRYAVVFAREVVQRVEKEQGATAGDKVRAAFRRRDIAI